MRLERERERERERVLFLRVYSDTPKTRAVSRDYSRGEDVSLPFPLATVPTERKDDKGKKPFKKRRES